MAEHETKFVFPAVQSMPLINWLLSRCVEDGDYPRGVISSVYYDTLAWNFLAEKNNSDFLKTKFRLRWYQDTGYSSYSAMAYFEKKRKIGSSREKMRVEVPLDDAVKKARYLNDPYFIELPGKVYSQSLPPERSILPAFQISYVRHRFVEPLSGARLAVDSEIHVPRINPMMVKRNWKEPLNVGVFEFKSSSMDLPDRLHGITVFGCRKGSFSKYSNCFEHITGLTA
ncbi:VTC domain-containing protein [Desulfopila inferna]|uniref:VTC domain-containing protein n=1 Tax=Desulfopila inferna TaxID=468528 RepID=UPI001963F1E2|nr:VTC domain-containing protein [Desulfopila inferna]MBM9603737.1 VTC domain-containing protein [Desulfopila inferna]